jgi:hypothetical protein
MHWLERAPLWIIGLAILAGLIVAEQIGSALRRRFMLRGAASEQADDSIAYVLSGALALLGLLIAFTFSAASDRFDTRRHLVVEEANAIGTTYLRIQALDDAPRAALSQLMVQYVHVRRDWYLAGEDAARLAQTGAATDDLQTRMWAVIVADVRANPTATINPSLLQTTNDMFDLAASRRAAMDGRLPIPILRALLLYGLIAAAIMGYGTAKGTRQMVVSAGLYLALSIAVCLILDLDRPRSGTVIVSQAPMDRAITAVESAEAAKAAAATAKPANP